MQSRILGWVTAGLVALVTACSDDDGDPAGAAGSGTGGGQAGASAGGAPAGGQAGTGGAGAGAGGGTAGSNAGAEDQKYPDAVGPAFGELASGWNTLTPGGDTICSKGTPFIYFVRPGASDKIVIEFSGGGACWNDSTCALADGNSSVFTPTADPPPYIANEASAKGISDHSKAENPVKDWTHVYISYCTGDIHAGDNVKTYKGNSGDIEIHHKGATNTRAVLAWVFKNFTSPQQVLMTGCSAGGYGATFWAPHVKRHYPQARVYHFSDSAAGIISPSFFGEINQSWKPSGVYPTYIPGADPSTDAKLSTYYKAVAAFYPEMPLAQFNTIKDSTQVTYFSFISGGKEADWSKAMVDEMATIHASASNFSSYVAPGSKHCVIPFNEFYSLDVGGQNPAAWLGTMLADQKPTDVACDTCK